MFLGAVGNVKEVEKYLDFSNDENLAREIQGKSFSTWKTQVSLKHTHIHTLTIVAYLLIMVRDHFETFFFFSYC